MSAENKSLEVRNIFDLIQLYDLKQEIVQNSYMHKIIEKNYNTITVNLKKNEIVGKEMEKLEDNTKLYDRIGRM